MGKYDEALKLSWKFGERLTSGDFFVVLPSVEEKQVAFLWSRCYPDLPQPPHLAPQLDLRYRLVRRGLFRKDYVGSIAFPINDGTSVKNAAILSAPSEEAFLERISMFLETGEHDVSYPPTQSG